LFTKIVLDILKPHEPSIIELSRSLCELKSIDRVNIVVQEVDSETETVKVTVEGHGMKFHSVRERIEQNGGVVHGIDEVELTRVKR